MFKLAQLHYFVITVEAGSMTQAAKTLFISQPALSKQLSLLEKELNCQLFQRKTTGIELTKAGKFFYDKAVVILRGTESLAKSMEAFSSKNTIKIGALPSIGSYFLPSVISKIGSSFKVELTLKDTTQELIDLLDSDFIDFAYVQDTSNLKNNIKCKELFWEPYDAIVPGLQASESTITLDEFLQHNLILHKHPCDIRLYFEKYCRDQNLDFNVLIDLEANESIIPFVSKGIGSSILPRMVTSQIQDNSIKIIQLEEEKLKRRVDFLYKPMLKKIALKLFAYSLESSFI
ncbi:LysR family transcriptional regulator [Bacillus salipaludis]|uniref:LysR family transcriptional regulator n=1 Tax=Bacillus salipaludis TaxID=2547811 RepID=A0AA90QLJ3_9BACI|nr:LysR family transcriptional regulator [Bacillus salipaludis]MDQ6595765.1 LysR family transcriptional regulator [Bacillus salipaludis]